MLSVPLQHKPVCSEIIIMVTIDAETARSAIINFKCDLKNLTYKDGNKHKSKACLICNHLLEWNDRHHTVGAVEEIVQTFLGMKAYFCGSSSCHEIVLYVPWKQSRSVDA
jgi:hypothetical protein